MIHTYEQTLQILYRHSHASLSRLPLSKLSGQTVAINGNSLLRNLVLKPNVFASPERGLPKNRHLEGFYEIGRYLKDNNVTPLFVFEDTEKFQGYGSEHQRRHFLKDHGIQGLKFELQKQANLPKVGKIFRDYLAFSKERQKISNPLPPLPTNHQTLKFTRRPARRISMSMSCSSKRKRTPGYLPNSWSHSPTPHTPLFSYLSPGFSQSTRPRESFVGTISSVWACSTSEK